MNTTFATILEIVGTLAFAISGIRLAAAKQLIGSEPAVGLVTAIGGGTLRDVLLNATPFWMIKWAQLPHRNGHSSYFRHYFQTILGKTRKYVLHIRYDRVSSICRRGEKKHSCSDFRFG